MAIGISTSCFYPEKTETAFQKIGESGCKLTEIFFNSPGELESGFIDNLKSMQNTYGLRVKSLHTFASFAEGFYYFSNYERRFYDSLETFKRYFYAANTLCAKILVMHGVKQPQSISDEAYFERFGKLCALGRENGVLVAQENVSGYRSENPEFLQRMHEALGDSFHLVLDVKQARRAGYSPYEYAEKFADCICHVHISDCTAERDCITPLTGEFDFRRFFNAMQEKGYAGDYIIELYRNSFEKEAEIFQAYSTLEAYL